MHGWREGRRGLGFVATMALVVSLLTAAGTAGVSAAAPGAVDPRPVPAMAWKISELFDVGAQLRAHELGDGATEAADGVVTFPRGTGSFDPVTGETFLRFQGWVEATNVEADGSARFAVKVEDPWIQIDADGNGRMRAVVTSTVFAVPPDVEDTVNLPTRVLMTTFRAQPGDWSLSDALYSTRVTPAWDGVLPAGSAAADDLGFASGTPVNGRAFAVQFLQHLNFPLRTLFVASSATTDPAKAPADIAIQAPDGRPGVAAGVVSSSAERVVVRADGFGFTSVTNPGDDGIVVALAEAGRLADLPLAAGETVARVRVPREDMLDDNWSVDLVAAVADRSNDYAVYTWQSPDRSTSSQDTETAVDLDEAPAPTPPPPPPAPGPTTPAPTNPATESPAPSAQGPSRARTTTRVKLFRAPTTRRSGKVKVIVRSPGGRPAGRVKIKLRGPGVRKIVTKRVRGRTVAWRTPALDRRRYRVVATYVRSKNFRPSRDVVTFRVRR